MADSTRDCVVGLFSKRRDLPEDFLGTIELCYGTLEISRTFGLFPYEAVALNQALHYYYSRSTRRLFLLALVFWEPCVVLWASAPCRQTTECAPLSPTPSILRLDRPVKPVNPE